MVVQIVHVGRAQHPSYFSVGGYAISELANQRL